MLKFVVDVTEDDKAFKVSAELPGIEHNDIDVSVSKTSNQRPDAVSESRRTDRTTFPSAAGTFATHPVPFGRQPSANAGS